MKTKHVTPKKRHKPSLPTHRSTANRTPSQFLLESFTEANLTTWNRQSAAANEYEVRRYFCLAGQRSLIHDQICTALRDRSGGPLELKNWVRIVDLEYTALSIYLANRRHCLSSKVIQWWPGSVGITVPTGPF